MTTVIAPACAVEAPVGSGRQGCQCRYGEGYVIMCTMKSAAEAALDGGRLLCPGAPLQMREFLHCRTSCFACSLIVTPSQVRDTPVETRFRLAVCQHEILLHIVVITTPCRPSCYPGCTRGTLSDAAVS